MVSPEGGSRTSLRAKSFDMVTWNCFGAAQGIVAWWRWRGIPEGHRLEHPFVHGMLGEVDVVCLQEVYLAEAEEMFARLDQPHKRRDYARARWKPPTIGGSGLAIASRHPIVSTESRRFIGSNVGAERLARKGVMHARLDVHGTLVDFFVTHLQSGYGVAPERVRARQLAQLREHVAELGAPDRPSIVCGDLNVDGRSATRSKEYATLQRIFDGFEDLGAADDRTTFHPHPAHNPLAHRFEPGAPEQRIDYVLFRAANGARATPPKRILDTVLEGTRTHPSDHYGLRVSLTL